MAISRALRAAVRERANACCEYCRFPEQWSALKFVVDHIRARQHDGLTEMGNLAFCCQFCNYHKGPNGSGFHPDTGDIVRLFNPRQDIWEDHFMFKDAFIVGRSAIGLVTVQVLALNDRDQVEARQTLVNEGKMKI